MTTIDISASKQNHSTLPDQLKTPMTFDQNSIDNTPQVETRYKIHEKTETSDHECGESYDRIKEAEMIDSEDCSLAGSDRFNKLLNQPRSSKLDKPSPKKKRPAIRRTTTIDFMKRNMTKYKSKPS